MDAESTVRELRAVDQKHADTFVHTFALNISDMARDCANMIESQAARIAELEAALEESRRRERAAVDVLQRIDWVGSGAKGRIEEAIGMLIGDGPSEAGEETK